jgi:hypothetical protein
MKRIIVLLLSILFMLTLTGCGLLGPHTETDYPAAIMAEGEIYLKSAEPMPAEIDESTIIGYTTSYTDTFPKNDGEANFSRELNLPYARVEGGIAVLVENEWYLCTPKNTDSGSGGGTITFYNKPTRERTKHVDVHTTSISQKQAEKLRKIIDKVDTWANDALVDRLAYYFDGHIEFSGDKKLYYFTYAYNVIYFNQQFAEIPAEDMQVIKDIAVSKDIPVDLHLQQPGNFSYAEVTDAFQVGDSGVKSDGFVNIEPAPISRLWDAKSQATKECTIDYDTVSVAYDDTAEIWEVTFSTGTPGGCQSVYMDRNGVTLLIVYGE